MKELKPIKVYIVNNTHCEAPECFRNKEFQKSINEIKASKTVTKIENYVVLK